jgi:3-hydroxyisobutyrate dehydrogenase-like beta-hydroxyacid dehydrogenase
MNSLPKLGFIGLGNMGKPMSSRLLERGYQLVVFDSRNEAIHSLSEKGALAAKSPAAIGSETDIVLISLPTPDIVREVAIGENGLIHGRRFHTYIDLSTTGPDVAQLVGDRLVQEKIGVLDAPVSGGVPGAITGSLSIMASGPRQIFEECRPILRAIGDNIFYVGDKIGHGQVMKLINNFLSATALAATSEAVVLGAKAGLNPKSMIDILNASSGRNSATLDKFPKSILPGTYDYGFKTSLMCKDLDLCMEMANGMCVPTWIGGIVRQVWNFARYEIGSDSDFTTIFRYFEKRANL